MKQMNLSRFKNLSLCAIGAAIFGPFVAHAQTEITIDTSILQASSTATSIQDFISRFYEIGLGISGIIAVGMIVVGAIYYTISGASPQKKGEAKDIIFSAIWGVVLLFGSYLILRSVNPQLIELRDPGSGLGDSLPEITSQDCSKMENLPECAEGQSATNPETGICECRPKTITQVTCPEKFKPVSFSPYPNYSWYSTSETIYNNNRGTVGNSSFVARYGDMYCAKKVNIPEGAEFRTIDCDDCVEGDEWWSTSYESWGEYEDGEGEYVDTTGWVWAYYPKDTDLGQRLTAQQKLENQQARANGDPEPWNLGSFAMCVMYAHYDPEDKEIERSDLDGLKPCTEFSSSTKSAWGSFTYGSTPPPVSGEGFSISSSTILSALPLQQIDSTVLRMKSPCVVGDGRDSSQCACRFPADYSGDKSKCLTKTSLQTKLKNLEQKIDSSIWIITEAFPPTVQHSSSCHMSTGGCVDVVITPVGGNLSCSDLQYFINEAQSVGLQVLNEYSYCGGTQTEYGTGNHLHLYE